MSQYVLIAGVIIVAVGQTLVGIAAIISSVKGNQTKDATEKRALKVASYFLAFSILFGLLTIISGIILAGTKGCSRANRIFFAIVFIIFAICYIIGLTIIYIYYRRRVTSGDTASARDLRTAFTLPLVAIPLYIVGFILIFVVLGRRLRRVRKICNQQQAKGQKTKR